MNPELQKILTRDFSGTLADFRLEAKKQFNGTAWRAIRPEGQPRRLLAVCMTGAHEIAKLGLKADGAAARPDWNAKPLIEGVLMALLTRQIIYQDELSGGQLASVLFIAADPDSITYLERRFNLPG
jgi:hypothetical protein